MVAPRRTIAALWLVSGGVIALVLSAVVFFEVGHDEQGTQAALRATARLSFALFLVFFAAPPAGSPLSGRGTVWLGEHKYAVFSAFVAAHFVHLGLILRLYRLSPDNPFEPAAVALGGLAYALIFAMFVSLAFELAGERVSQRILETVATYYVWLVFTVTFAGALDEQGWPVLVALTVALAMLPARLLGVRSAQRSRAAGS